MNVYTDHQGLQKFYIKQKLNSEQASWYLHMYTFIYHVHCRPGFKIGKPDGLSGCSGQEKYGMDRDFFDEVQLLDLANNDMRQEEDMEDVELEGIDVATWEKKNRLWVVLQEYRLEVLRQRLDSQVSGH